MPQASSDLRRFFRHSGIYAFGNALDRLSALMLLPIYTRFLSVGEYGLLELFYAMGSIVSGFLSVGLAHATLRFYFEYERQEDRNAVVSTNLLASLTIGAAGAIPIAFFASEAAAHFLNEPRYGPAVWLLLATIVLELSSQVSLSYLRAEERSILFVSVCFAKLLTQVVVNTFAVVVLDAGVVGVLAGNLATVAIGWVILAWFTFRRCGTRFEWPKLLPVLRYSFPLLLTTIVGLVSANLDRLLISGLLDLRALGLYALASKLAKVLQDLIGEPFNQAYGAFRFTIMDKPDAGEIQARIVRYLLVASCFAGLGLSYFVAELLRVMSAPEFRPAAEVVPILALAAIMRLMTYPAQTGILYGKHTRHLFHISLVVAAVNLLAGFILISWLGLEGACLAVLLSSAVVMALTNRISQRYYHVAYPYARLARVLAVTVAFYLLSLPLAGLGAWGAVGAKLALLPVYAWALVWVGGIEARELAEARAFVAGRLKSMRGAA